jgi:BirA family biotin operon repressor/biotin-[acetyl-CoA-carboxylase] ligase
MQLAQDGSEEGVVFLTDSQTAGKGRQGRRWVDASGHNAISSIVLRPSFPPYFLVMIASLAVVDAIHEVCAISAAIKWPNDVLLGERKVAGILIETSHDRSGRFFAIMGVGVNVNGHIPAPDGEPLSQATTLEMECGHSVDRERFIASLLWHIEQSYIALQRESFQMTTGAYPGGIGSPSRLIRERWRSQLSTLGRTIEVRQGKAVIHGLAEDVDDIGELLLRLHSGERVSITWGDVGHVG